MKLFKFKTVDDRFKSIGFEKKIDNEYCVLYVRTDPKYGYTQCLDILHKTNGQHIVQSYDREFFDDSHIGNTCGGLTYYEMSLALRKMRQKGWRSR